MCLKDEITEIIGIAATVSLFENLGGCVCLFAKDSPMLTHSGIEQKHWQALCDYYRGETVYIAKRHQRMMRDMAIYRDKQHGSTLNDLAGKYGLTRRQVINICNQFRKRGG